MSVSKSEVGHGSAVISDSVATVPTSRIGCRPSPCVRITSAMTQTLSADCSTTAGHNANGTLLLRIRP